MLAVRLFTSLLALLAACGAWARQDPRAVQRTVDEFLAIQTKGLPGAVSFTVGAIDPNNNLTPCSALEAFAAPGARLWGRSTVGVRCRDEAGWSLYVPVRIAVVGEYLVAARALAQGQVLAEGDLATSRGDLAELPAGILTEPALAVGRTLSMSVVAGRPVRSDMLRQPLAVQQGQSIKVLARGSGFNVSTEGKALANAADGQVVQVRTASGQTVSGIARAGGWVEVRH
jgi:flagella basal body P-ring formation protein FlgA